MNHTDLDIIYFTLFPWDGAYSSVSLSFTREFAKNNRVFYVNLPYTLKSFVEERKTPMAKERRKDMLLNRLRYESIPDIPGVVAMQPPMTLPINWLNPGPAYDRLSALNNRIVINAIEQMIKDYHLKNFIYLNCFNPYYARTLPQHLNPRLNIYQCIDDMNEEEYTARHGARLEEQAIRDSDITFVTSRNLFSLKNHLNPNTYVLHNAVDNSIFKKAVEKKLPRPEELKGVSGKIIGFTGNINGYRLDYPLIKKIAETHRDKTLVMVGPLNSDDYKVYGLDKMPNVVLTGGKDITELPAFLQHFDVTIIPFLCNKLTKSIYPLKVNEYLSAGKPVVSTSFSEDIRSFEKDLYLADGTDEFVRLIDVALNSDNESFIKHRIATANVNTWSERVREFWEIVEMHLDRHSSKTLLKSLVK